MAVFFIAATRELAKMIAVIATFELSKADLEEAVTDYINKVLQPNVGYDLGDLTVTFTVDEFRHLSRREGRRYSRRQRRR